MRVKRYVGETAQEAMQKVKSDLGRDAIILNTRKIRKKGLAGIFSKPLIEVVATIDNDISSKPAKQKQERAAMNMASADREAPFDNTSFIDELNASLSQNKQTAQPIQPTYQPTYRSYNAAADEEIIPAAEQPAKTTQSNIEEITKSDLTNDFTPAQINEIKEMLNKVYDAVKLDYESSKLTDTAKNYLEQLERSEVDKVILNDLKEELIEELSIEQQQDTALVKETIHKILNGYIKDPEPFSTSSGRRVIVFIGPTGVGKTTTLAKLAANLVLNEKKKVGLITSDTYRIAAVEQLKTYSEIIGIPLSAIYSSAEIANAIESYRDKDIILIDTAGRSHKDQYQVMELKSLLKSSVNFEIYLVISATTKFSDCIEIIKSYGFLDDYKLLFTKLDETSTTGVMLNVAYITKKPISYITTGQSVPDDIEIADKEKIINSLIGDN
ncbi:MAG: flagellar biosynthetic protein FlhF [Clostridia bacterium]|nr:flagellar biosynthetic protein FlhF [Clostridia bacterium]